LYKDDIILQAALEFGADYRYTIKNGTLGLTFYIEAENKREAAYVRELVPSYYEGLYTVVLYTSSSTNT
jgi:hypothetical protein